MKKILSEGFLLTRLRISLAIAIIAFLTSIFTVLFFVLFLFFLLVLDQYVGSRFLFLEGYPYDIVVWGRSLLVHGFYLILLVPFLSFSYRSEKEWLKIAAVSIILSIAISFYLAGIWRPSA